MEDYPFGDHSTKHARHAVKHGRRPHLSEGILNSTDASIVAMREAMALCHVEDPNTRASARQVQVFLMARLEMINPARLREWGVIVS
jgi:hypothetical protein